LAVNQRATSPGYHNNFSRKLVSSEETPVIPEETPVFSEETPVFPVKSTQRKEKEIKVN